MVILPIVEWFLVSKTFLTQIFLLLFSFSMLTLLIRKGRGAK